VRAQVARLVSSRAGLICERLEARPARLAGGCGANRDPQLIRSVLPRAKGADRPNARPSLTRPGETHEFGSANEFGQRLTPPTVSEMAGKIWRADLGLARQLSCKALQVPTNRTRQSAPTRLAVCRDVA